MRSLEKFTVVAIAMLAVILLLPVGAMAQEGPDVSVTMDWMHLLSLFVNSVLVVAAVSLLGQVLPDLPGGVKQILALVAGPLLLWAQTALTAAIGYPVDFGPLIELFAGLSSGLAAMGLFDVGKRVNRALRAPA